MGDGLVAGRISVVIPAYNEASRLPHAVASIGDYLKATASEFEIVVVDDGSTDATVAITEGLAADRPYLRLVRLGRNAGKGAAVKAGMLSATGDYVLFTDADQSTSIEHLGRLMKALEDGFAIAIGSRSVDGAVVLRGQGHLRQTLGKIWGLLTKALVVRGYVDSQCGFKCFRRAAVDAIFVAVTSRSVLFDAEVLLLAGRAGMRVAEVPVTWVHDPDTRIEYGLRRAIATFGELLRIRRHWRVVLPVKLDVTRVGG